jgi:hypothetical protein
VGGAIAAVGCVAVGPETGSDGPGRC